MYKMQAIEFESTINNGIIRIPDEYKEQIDGQVKVILLSEALSTGKIGKPLSAVSINTKGFKFDRDDANAR
jgi:hypothetical protein